MVTFIPSNVQDDIKEHFSEVEINSRLYSIKAIENGNVEGVCLFSLDRKKASVSLEKLQVMDTEQTVEEGLIRAVLNFAANRGMYMAYVNDNSDFNNNLLRKMHFEEFNNKFSCDIPTALTGNCCR